MVNHCKSWDIFWRHFNGLKNVENLYEIKFGRITFSNYNIEYLPAKWREHSVRDHTHITQRNKTLLH